AEAGTPVGALQDLGVVEAAQDERAVGAVDGRAEAVAADPLVVDRGGGGADPRAVVLKAADDRRGTGERRADGVDQMGRDADVESRARSGAGVGGLEEAAVGADIEVAQAV